MGSTRTDRPIPERDPKTGRFVLGNCGGPGRPIGSRNKLGEAFLADLHRDWLEHGQAVIARCREEKPDAYLRVIAGLLPRDLKLTVNRFDDVSDDELIDRVRQIDAAIRPLLAAEGEAGPFKRTETPSRH
ncbi:hypothetical protein [Bauldia sp.]|uniref:hypothetical protein n=1 Tax=Bauldia sp. TaxID=2575872 RepID=UPI003BAB8FEE